MSFSAAQWSLAMFMVPLVGLSAICSCAETVLFGATAEDRMALRKSAPATSRRVEALLKDERQLLITILLANMGVNSLYFASSATVVSIGGLGAVGATAFAVASLLVLIVFGEILPKLVGNARRRTLGGLVVPPISVLHAAIGPFRGAVDRLFVAPLSRLTAPRKDPPRLGTAELAALLEQSNAAGVIDADEQQILRGVFSLRELRVRDVMTHRTDMVTLAAAAGREEIARVAGRSRLTRIPVHGPRGIDDIVGVLQVKRFLLDPRGALAPVSECIRPARFVPEIASLEQLFEDFRESGTDHAIVVDEYGGTAGVVAIEDCVEEIVGDIVAPDEEPIPAPRQVGLGAWEVPGEMNLRQWNAAFGEVRSSAASTLGGLVLERLGRPAVPGDRVRIANIELEVREIRGARIRSLFARILEEGEPGDG